MTDRNHTGGGFGATPSSANLPEITLKQVAALFDAIASLANRLDRATFRGIFEDDAGQLEIMLAQCRESVQRIGWMADLGCSKMGGYGIGQVRGGAEEWMLSTTAFNDLPAAQAGGVQ